MSITKKVRIKKEITGDLESTNARQKAFSTLTITNKVKCKPIAECKGKVFPEEKFLFYETDKFQLDILEEVLNGERAGVIFRNIISPEDRSLISKNFWKHPQRYIRDVDVPAHYVGAYHYEKTLKRYLEEAELYNSGLEVLFEGATNPFGSFLTEVSKYFKRKAIELRIAAHEKRLASPFVMRSWTDSGTYSLKPHEDEAQCNSLKQTGFEIQEAARNALVAVNICIENDGGGELHYWNIQPNQQTKEALGLASTGYPYPIEILSEIPKQIISIKPGDIYCFNGKAIHAVASLTAKNCRRATISFLMAQLNKNTIIYWA